MACEQHNPLSGSCLLGAVPGTRNGTLTGRRPTLTKTNDLRLNCTEGADLEWVWRWAWATPVQNLPRLGVSV